MKLLLFHIFHFHINYFILAFVIVINYIFFYRKSTSNALFSYINIYTSNNISYLTVLNLRVNFPPLCTMGE